MSSVFFSKDFCFLLTFFFSVLQDFGDHADQYYSVQTQEGEQIAALIAGYIDIILRKVFYLSFVSFLY